jgi:hypothetical protein
VDAGSHEELLDSSSVYREIHASQLAEADEDLARIHAADGAFNPSGMGDFEKELVS